MRIPLFLTYVVICAVFFTSYSKEVWITVLVHGNISIKPFLSYKNIRNLMFDAVDTTEYAHGADAIRTDPFFYQVQQMQDLGLLPIDKNSCKKGDACAAFTKIFDDLVSYTQKDEENYYYTFGWSGLMSHSKRLKEASYFYEQLVKLIENYKEKNIYPKIRLIGYSHGGNVCLNVAEAHKQDRQKKIDSIDQVILLGMPVQAENAHLVKSNLFKKVYHFYSTADKIQRIDFFSFKRFFSKKRFRSINSDNLTQIAVSLVYNNQDFSPGHTELWFFGWTAFNYRKEFPLYPFSLVHILPILLDSIEKYKPVDHLVLKIYPEEERLTLSPAKNKKRKKNNAIKNYSFLSKEKHAELTEKALRYLPESYTMADENEHIRLALCQGKTNYQDSKLSKVL
jgi:pimeloyl-ACP methyl ester carboxylesterase